MAECTPEVLKCLNHSFINSKEKAFQKILKGFFI